MHTYFPIGEEAMPCLPSFLFFLFPALICCGIWACRAASTRLCSFRALSYLSPPGYACVYPLSFFFTIQLQLPVPVGNAGGPSRLMTLSPFLHTPHSISLFRTDETLPFFFFVRLLPACLALNSGSKIKMVLRNPTSLPLLGLLVCCPVGEVALAFLFALDFSRLDI
ncbi:hypothetical protein ABW19_dt0204516 [Dactylella cylindrospora]|nr:hypothetical protein ABW19_dt0204516 [Dactylella cylindrospora]